MQREKLAERGRGAGRSPTAAGGESRRSLLCSGGAGTGCARFCSPGKCGGGVGGAAAGQGSGLRRAGAGGPVRGGACGGQVQGAGRAAGRPGCAGAGGLRPPKPSFGRFGMRPPANPPPAKNPPTAVGGFRYLFRDYSSAGASSSTGSSSGASSASSALMDRLAR